jgi:hypothetical protein
MPSRLLLNTQLLKKRIPNISAATRRAGLRSATVFDLYSGRTTVEHAEVRTLKALANLAGCSMDELVIEEPAAEESFAESLRRWAAMPEGVFRAPGPRRDSPPAEDDGVAFLRKLPRTGDQGPASPKPAGPYAV